MLDPRLGAGLLVSLAAQQVHGHDVPPRPGSGVGGALSLRF